MSGSYSGCAVGEYYSPTMHLYDPSQMHALLRTTHRKVVPYTSTAPDCWDALIALDGDSTGQYVRQIYSDKYANATDYGETHSWNREHVWPKSRGVGYDGPDFTDLHALRPADWNVNAARNNRHFAPCGIAEVANECVSPAHVEAAPDTERDSYTFMPPADRRGDVARATFYMAVRYDGTEVDTLDLELTDCPDANAVDDGKLAYLSHLLRWHESDPVDDAERARNDAVCSDWQGNRNPFVDFPELVPYYFGLPRDYPSQDGVGYDCSVPNPAGPPPLSAPPTSVPTPAPPVGPVTGGGGTCKGLAHGDIMPVGMRSDNPDVVVLVALAGVPDGAEIYITDSAWTGTEFKTNEGVKKFTAPAGGLSAGTVFGYGDAILPHSSSWSSAGGTFSLSASGEAIHVYCLDVDATTGANTVPYHLSALSYSGGWAPASTDPASFTTTQSSKPVSLPNNAVVTLGHKDNYRYTGPTSGTRSELMEFIAAPIEWSGADSTDFDATTGWSDFTVTVPPAPPGACTTLTGGDVMIAGYNADDPDSVALVALADLPGGVDLYLTDAAWTGSQFKDQEGLRKYAVPSEGVAKGTVFGYGGDFTEVWESMGGSFSLSVSSDAIFVYCLGASSSILHLSALTYSTDGWIAPSPDDESVFSTSKSSLPSSLCSNCSVDVGSGGSHSDNAVYVGNRLGTKGELLADMSDKIHWVGDDGQRYDLKFVLGQFVVEEGWE